MTAPALPTPHTVRFWTKNWDYAFGCELLEPLERGAQPDTVRIHVAQTEAAALVRDQGDSIRHVTVDDAAKGRYCGAILSWTINRSPDGMYVDALDLNRYVAKLAVPSMPAMTNPFAPAPGEAAGQLLQHLQGTVPIMTDLTDDTLRQWIYDHEYDWNGPVDGSKAEWDEWCELPNPGDTFPRYYADDYNRTIAAMCREILRLRAQLTPED